MRIKKGWRQQDVAERAGVARSVVSRIERGEWKGVSVTGLLALADALGVRVRIGLTWQGADLDRLINVRHSLLHEEVARMLLAMPGWAIAPEVSYSIYGERGVIDVLAWHAPTRMLLVTELKTELVELNELMSKVDQKAAARAASCR